MLAMEIFMHRKLLYRPTTVLSDIEVTLGAYGEVGIGDRIVPLDPEDAKTWTRHQWLPSRWYHRVR
jgi:hypothetical protein